MTDSYPAPLDDAALGATWASARTALGRPAPAGMQAEQMTACSEPHRHVHDQRHQRECLALWTRWRDNSPRPGEVAIALWFHDAVYDRQAGSDELNIAAWAACSLVPAGADSYTAQVLQRFLDRPRLDHGEHAVALLKAQARINLAAALSWLAQ